VIWVVWAIPKFWNLRSQFCGDLSPRKNDCFWVSKNHNFQFFQKLVQDLFFYSQKLSYKAKIQNRIRTFWIQFSPTVQWSEMKITCTSLKFHTLFHISVPDFIPECVPYACSIYFCFGLLLRNGYLIQT